LLRTCGWGVLGFAEVGTYLGNLPTYYADNASEITVTITLMGAAVHLYKLQSSYYMGHKVGPSPRAKVGRRLCYGAWPWRRFGLILKHTRRTGGSAATTS
jgi:hypothetical protein